MLGGLEELFDSRECGAGLLVVPGTVGVELGIMLQESELVLGESRALFARGQRGRGAAVVCTIRVIGLADRGSLSESARGNKWLAVERKHARILSR